MADAERVRAIYNKVADHYDRFARRPTLEAMRARLLRRASGDVLELGVGTGATFPHYPPAVASLAALDLSEAMLERARDAATALRFPVRLLRHDAQKLPFADASFDTVVSSLGLCGIPDPAALFAEAGRVLRPAGRLLALEHVRPPHPALGWLADLVDPAFDRVVGCHANRRTPDLLRAAGFAVRVLDVRLAGVLVALEARA